MDKVLEGLVARFQNREAQIAIIGMGYVGLPLAIAMVRAGFRVVGIDVDESRIADLGCGESPTGDVSNECLRKAIANDKLELTQDFAVVAEADAVVVCVPSPLTRHREPDLSHIEEATESIIPHLRKGQLIVLESTSYPGTTEELIKPRLEAQGFEVGKDIYLAFSPERVDPGNKEHVLQSVQKVVGGVTPACTEIAKTLYEQIISAEVHTVSSPRAAEMEKLLENIFRNVNIALVNELTQLCERMDIDIWEVIEAAKTKPYGFMPFYPGPGVGGHCIPVDPFYLSWKAKEYDFRVRFIELAGEINANMPAYVVSRLGHLLNSLRKPLAGSRILVLGIAYKRDIADTRESPGLRLLKLLQEAGADVRFHDPFVSHVTTGHKDYQSTDLTSEVLRSSDAVVLVTDHSDLDHALIVEYAKLILDTRGVLKEMGGNVFRI